MRISRSALFGPFFESSFRAEAGTGISVTRSPKQMLLIIDGVQRVFLSPADDQPRDDVDGVHVRIVPRCANRERECRRRRASVQCFAAPCRRMSSILDSGWPSGPVVASGAGVAGAGVSTAGAGSAQQRRLPLRQALPERRQAPAGASPAACLAACCRRIFSIGERFASSGAAEAAESAPAGLRRPLSRPVVARIISIGDIFAPAAGGAVAGASPDPFAAC